MLWRSFSHLSLPLVCFPSHAQPRREVEKREGRKHRGVYSRILVSRENVGRAGRSSSADTPRLNPKCVGNLRSPGLGSTQSSPPSLFRATNHLGSWFGEPLPQTDRKGPALAPLCIHTAGSVSTATPRGWGLVRRAEKLPGEPVPSAFWFRSLLPLREEKFSPQEERQGLLCWE